MRQEEENSKGQGGREHGGASMSAAENGARGAVQKEKERHAGSAVEKGREGRGLRGQRP